MTLTATEPSLKNGGAVTVRGRQGVYVPSKESTSEVAVRLDDGRWLVVHELNLGGTGRPAPKVALTEDELVTIMNGITIDPRPDYSWIGTR